MSIRIWKLSKVEWPCELCDKTILVGYCEGHEVSTNCNKKTNLSWTDNFRSELDSSNHTVSSNHP